MVQSLSSSHVAVSLVKTGNQKLLAIKIKINFVRFLIEKYQKERAMDRQTKGLKSLLILVKNFIV